MLAGVAQARQVDQDIAEALAHLLADDVVHQASHLRLRRRGVQARQREARAVVQRRAPLGALFGHANVEGLLREQRRGHAAVGGGVSGNRAQGQSGAWGTRGARAGPASASAFSLAQLSTKIQIQIPRRLLPPLSVAPQRFALSAAYAQHSPHCRHAFSDLLLSPPQPRHRITNHPARHHGLTSFALSPGIDAQGPCCSRKRRGVRGILLTIFLN